LEFPVTYTLRYRRGSFDLTEEFDSLLHAISHAEILALAGKGSFMTIERGTRTIMADRDLQIAWRARQALTRDE
jgi:hypothetical protein